MLLLLFGVAIVPARALQLPPGFSEEKLVDKIDAAVALAVSPDGRIFYAEQTGALRVVKDGQLLSTLALDLSARLDTYWERGLIGVTLDPNFPHTPEIYVLYVAKAPYVHHVVSRFTMNGDAADPASEKILLEGDDQGKFGGNVPAGHQGGPLRFGADGKLYIGLGEQTANRLSQSLEALQGKILRINPDGSIPEDNPFYTKTTGKYRSIWVIGIRNPFGLAVQPGSGRMFVSDVGESSWEEVDEIFPGENYGWPDAEGMSTNPRFQNPIHTYPPVIGRCIAGGTFYPTAGAGAVTGIFPSEWRGKFFFCDWAVGWMKALDPANPQHVVTFGQGLNNPVAIEAAPDGSLVVLNRGTIWRDNKNYRANSGSLIRIRFDASKVDQARTFAFPATLEAAKIVRSLKPFAPGPDFVRFGINLPPWQPGLHARRWIKLPPGGRVGFSADGEWSFPNDTWVIVQYELDSSLPRAGQPFETQLFCFTGPRSVRAAAFRWSDDGKDAKLVTDPSIVSLPGDPKHHWFSPGPEEHLDLDTVVTGFLLPLNTRQLNRQEIDSHSDRQAGQLAAWNERGWFDPPLTKDQVAGSPHLSAPGDSSMPVETRIRSYLDVNCSVCHHPGGLARGNFDARYSTPLPAQNLLDGPLIAGDLGVSGAKVIVPGAPEKSVLYLRLTRTDPYRMPPISVNDDPQPVVPLLEQWIRSMHTP